MTNCPYDQTTIHLALLTMSQKIEKLVGEVGQEELAKRIERIVPNSEQPETTRAAEHHGITVEALINSPNYKTLVESYNVDLVTKIVSGVQETCGFDHKEAWAFLLAGKGLIG